MIPQHSHLAVFFLLVAPSLWAAPPAQVRFATFNCSMNRTDLGVPLTDALADPASNSSAAVKAKKLAEIIQRVRPDVLLLNEFDYSETNPTLAPQRLQDHFLGISQNGQPAITFPYRYVNVPNTGYLSGFDLDNNGVTSTLAAEGTEGYGNDCYGFGRWRGQYGMVVFSMYPIPAASVRTFRNFLWKNMPNPLWPDAPGTPEPADWYNAAEKLFFRLSSKSHWDLSVDCGGQIVHFLVSHPTPPAFDGPEDRNGKRNHDEIRFWADYIEPARSAYCKDDANRTGGLAALERFVIAGDLNADPHDGDSVNFAARQLTDHPLIDHSFVPASLGAPQAAINQGGKNTTHVGNPAHDTADFGDGGTNPGNLRVDYVLPSHTGLKILGGGVFWPPTGDPTANLITISDHRLVWLDLQIEPIPEKAVRNLQIVRTGTSVTLTWQALAGHAYAVEESADLAGSWLPVSSASVVVQPDTLLATAVVPNVPVGKRFYRIVITFSP